MDFLVSLWASVQSFFFANWNRVLLFFVTLIAGVVMVKVAIGILTRVIDRSKLKGAAGNFMLTLAKTALSILYVIVLLSMLGVDTTSLVAIFSVLTLAISLAVQGVVSDLASGIMLVATKPFEEGDYVEIDGNGGTVEHIFITCTKLKTGDNKVVTIPNSSVTGSTIINYSTKGTRRLDLTFSAAYGTDVALVKETILSVIARHEEIFAEPAPMVRLTAHGASSIDFLVRVWLKSGDYWKINFDLKEEVYAAFNEKGIEIPFPQMDVHVIK